MKVRFDDQIFALQSRGGISRYFVELMREYGSDSTYGVELDSGPVWTRNAHLLEAGMGRSLPTGWGRRRRVLRVANRLHRAGGNSDLVHHTYFDRSYLPLARNGSIRAVTVYDMIPELYPELFPLGNPHLDKRAFVDEADLILCISEATRRDLVHVYGEPAAPIVVTPLGVDSRFRPDVPKPKDLPERYVLFIGNRGGYKDFSVLAEAFAVCRLPDDIKLVVAGGGPFSTEERELLQRLDLLTKAIRLDLGDADLPGVYGHALCFVFPSRHEGFGLPTLEAMASGCPTILVSSSSHPEVGGDAALYFPPGDVEALALLLDELMEAPERRAACRAAGLIRAAAFSWQDTARRTAEAYLGAGRARP